MSVCCIAYTAVVSLYRALYSMYTGVKSTLRVHSTPGGLDGRQWIDSGLNKVLGTAMGHLEPFETSADRLQTDRGWRSCTTVRETDPSCCIEACIENRSIEREIALYRLYSTHSLSRPGCTLYSVYSYTRYSVYSIQLYTRSL